MGHPSAVLMRNFVYYPQRLFPVCSSGSLGEISGRALPILEASEILVPARTTLMLESRALLEAWGGSGSAKAPLCS